MTNVEPAHAERVDDARRRRVLGAALAALWCAAVPSAYARDPVGTAARHATPPVRRIHAWAMRVHDHGGRPFAILDKPDARLHVFDAQGARLGHTPVLLGLARGDHTVPGIGDRPLAQVRPHERTTPAGRFVVATGRNADDERVVWIDYDAAVSIHAVIDGAPAERRAQRLRSPDPRQRRISYGCVNVPKDFFASTVLAAFPRAGGIVYVTPDREKLETVFPALVRA